VSFAFGHAAEALPAIAWMSWRREAQAVGQVAKQGVWGRHEGKVLLPVDLWVLSGTVSRL